MVRLSMIRLMLFLLLMVPSLSVADQMKKIQIGDDYFAAESKLNFVMQNIKDAFLFGQYITVTAALNGELHALGQIVEIESNINGEVYAVAQDIIISNKVGGDVNLIAGDIKIENVISGDVRAIGKRVSLNSPIDGNVILLAENVSINSVIQGDVLLIADELTWGPEANIKGSVTIYKNPKMADTNIDIPLSVISQDRILIKLLSYDDDGEDDFWSLNYTWRLVIAALITASITATTFAIAPKFFGDVVVVSKTQIRKHLLIGFISISALVGSVFVLGATIVGLILIPVVFVFLLILLSFALLPGSYVVGLKLMKLFGLSDAMNKTSVFLITFLGIGVTGHLIAIPFVGWILLLFLTFFGVGVIASGFYNRRIS